MPDREPQAIHTLVGEALRETTDLARKEFALFRAEMSENVRAIAMGLAMVIAAAVLAVAALIWLTQALVDWLATVVNSHALAALIVGVILAVLAAGLGLYGRRAMSLSTLTPRRTLSSIQRDGEVLSERVTG